jgi:putative phosphoribosyl transferase
VEKSHDAENRSRQAWNVQIPSDKVILQGELIVPQDLRGIVLFAHGSGSSRHSPRNKYVARMLQNAGIATLLFNIDLLAKRLRHAASWIMQRPQIKDVNVGFFGASTGAAAALVAVSEAGKDVAAVVSRGGRPDLAGPALGKVKAPTLLIVGGKDQTVLDLNREGFSRIPCEKSLEIIPGATHLFEEPGALEQVALLARQWFEGHLGRREDRIHAA